VCVTAKKSQLITAAKNNRRKIACMYAGARYFHAGGPQTVCNAVHIDGLSFARFAVAVSPPSSTSTSAELTGGKKK
jgi:hypothetical protein